ncbi:MAG: guanylate kinase [Candidatus Magasanikbacteria bacterium]|nr:guanylate kinase [Candidatus Magasanikbacteria bacterium]
MKGQLIIISSPSGGGKDSVIRGLLDILPDSARYLTTTTRPMRPGEKNGVDYHFVTRDEFEIMIKNDELIEYNIYADNYYGTEKNRLNELLNNHLIVFSNIEINGKKNFDKTGWKNVSIFLLPESLDILKQRIIARGGLTDEAIAKRLDTAKKEIAESDIYDYKLVNYQGKLDETVAKTAEIIKTRLGLDINEKLS